MCAEANKRFRSSQPEKRQNGDNDNNQSDEINDIVHSESSAHQLLENSQGGWMVPKDVFRV